MASPLKFIAPGQVVPTALHREMERSYLEYAMSVIVGRALPDVRDGLKPVHRRILYAMHELGLSADRPFRKCARVVGDVLGKYHPHGDQAVYDALVRMVQDFSSRYPLLAGHGNFGSVDNDPPAAMRYTETRLAAIGEQVMLEDISEAIVDFTNNFDNSQQEPIVLPARLPVLLLNGCSGIAVGMATNIPPHHLGEIVDGLIALTDRPQMRDAELWQLIPGPDFPTGGEIIETAGIREAYSTGRGIIPVRGVARIESLNVGRRRRKERDVIIVTELPYQVNKSAWIEKMAEMVNQGRLEGIADIRDESDRTGMRVVIELKRDADAPKVLKKLYRQTALQSNFGIIMLSLVDSRPVQLSLKEMLQEFLAFREATLRRQYQNQLSESQGRLHLVDGLLTALQNLDRLIDILRNAPDGSTAKQQLQAELEISEAQGDAILAMPLRRLTGLERQKLQAEAEELRSQISRLQNLLENRHELLKALKRELRSLKRKFSDERRTRILQPTFFPADLAEPEPEPPSQGQSAIQQPNPQPQKAGPEPELPPLREKPPPVSEQVDPPTAEIGSKAASSDRVLAGKSVEESDREPGSTAVPDYPAIAPLRATTLPSNIPNAPEPLQLVATQPPPAGAILCITPLGKIGWRSPQVPRPADRAIAGEFSAREQASLIVVADTGKLYPYPMADIPPLAHPQPMLDMLSKSAQKGCNRVLACFSASTADTRKWLLLTARGRIKRIDASELIADINARGLSVIKLKDGDRLQFWQPIAAATELILATSGGRLLRFALNEETVPILGRTAQGQPILRLRDNETLVGCLPLTETSTIALISKFGYGKQLAIADLRLGKVGDIGTQALRFKEADDGLAGIALARSVLSLWTDRGRQLSARVEDIPLTNKDGQGDRLVSLDTGESIEQIYPDLSAP